MRSTADTSAARAAWWARQERMERAPDNNQCSDEHSSSRQRSSPPWGNEHVAIRQCTSDANGCICHSLSARCRVRPWLVERRLSNGRGPPWKQPHKQSSPKSMQRFRPQRSLGSLQEQKRLYQLYHCGARASISVHVNSMCRTFTLSPLMVDGFLAHHHPSPPPQLGHIQIVDAPASQRDSETKAATMQLRLFALLRKTIASDN